MRKWIVILLACVAVLSGGAEEGMCLPPGVAAPAALRGGELTVCRRTLDDALTEYASNPAYLHFGAESSGALRRCPVTAVSGGRLLRHGGSPSFAAADLRCRRFIRLADPTLRAVLHPTDHYVFRMRRLLI